MNEVRERCGNLGRRIGSLEFKAGAKVGVEPVRDELLEAAEVLLRVCEKPRLEADDMIEGMDSLRTAISKERGA
jgi:hypothetical protein